MVGIANEISGALSGALLILVLIGKSLSTYRSFIIKWLKQKFCND
ncbi:Autoinducer 2 import system permease protein lsrD [Avibacterium paragallinarum]|nr:Autoinducer 2 import system permease protein lsrD [Avibacterium paragallinarum]